MSHQMIKDLLFQFLFAIQMFSVKMHFVLLLIHSSKVRYKIPKFVQTQKNPDGFWQVSGIWPICYILFVTTCTEHFLFVKDCKRWNEVDVLQVLHIRLQCLSFSFKAMHTLELQVFSELLFMRTVCEGSWTCLDKGK